MFLAPWLLLLQRLDTLAALCGGGLFLAAPSPAGFLGGAGPSPSCLLWAVLTSLLRSFVLLLMQDGAEGVFHAAPAGALCGVCSPPSWLSHVQALVCGLAVGSLKFLHAPIRRKGSGSTTTTTLILSIIEQNYSSII